MKKIEQGYSTNMEEIMSFNKVKKIHDKKNKIQIIFLHVKLMETFHVHILLEMIHVNVDNVRERKISALCYHDEG